MGNMIHYHGLPITPDTACRAAISGGHAFVSFRYPDQLGLAVEVAQSFAVDCGAFSAWKAGEQVEDWRDYYEWVRKISLIPSFDWAIIPDVIDGDERDNDALVRNWPDDLRHYGVPVWHMHESLGRLEKLAKKHHRVAIGSSGAFATIGNHRWWNRIAEAMRMITVDGKPICKLHGLRMLDTEIFTRVPFASADSTNIARNIGIDSRWTGAYSPPTKEARAQILRQRIEASNGAANWAEVMTQPCLFRNP